MNRKTEPTSMRTKAEAMANPEAGDKWSEGTVEAFYPPHDGLNWPEGSVSVRNGRYRLYLTFNGGWQRWAAGAEYLGNEGDR